MAFEEIFGMIVGVLALVGLFTMLIFMCISAEKTEEKKRDLYKEVSKYYRHRNEQFEEDNK